MSVTADCSEAIGTSGGSLSGSRAATLAAGSVKVVTGKFRNVMRFCIA